jgi:hypothetical protein
MFKPAIQTMAAATVVGLFSLNASADVTRNEALTLCIDKAKATYGESANIKMKKVKKRGDTTVQLWVAGVKEDRFMSTCVVNSEGEVVSIEAAE